MSDISTGGEPAVTDPGAPAGVPPVDTFDADPADKQYDRAYVTKLREEAARHRTEAKAAKDAAGRYTPVFEAWDEDDANVLLETIRLAATDPKAGAAQLQEIARILGGDITPTQEAPGGKPQGTALTQEDLDRVLNEREQSQALKAEVANVENEATALGYKKGTAAYFTLLWRTKEEFGFDMNKAHAAMEADKASAVAEYLAGKRAEAEGAAGAGPAGGAAPSAAQPIKTFRNASDSARARVAAMRRGQA